MSNPTGNALLHAKPSLRQVTERIVDGVDRLPPGQFYVATRKGPRLLIRRSDGTARPLTASEIAAAAELLNAARSLRPDGVRPDWGTP